MRWRAYEDVFLTGSGCCVIPFSRWNPVWKAKFLLQVRRVLFLFRHFPVKNQQFHDFYAILLAFLPYNKITVHASLITRWRSKYNRFTVDTRGLVEAHSYRDFVISNEQITKRRYEYNPYRLFVICYDRKFVIFSDLAGSDYVFSDMHQNVH